MIIETPTGLDLELAIIGCLLDGGKQAVDAALERLSVDAFYRVDCRQAFLIIRELHESGKGVDTVSLFAEWKAKHPNDSPADILASPNSVEHVANISDYLDTLLDRGRRRRGAQAWIRAAKLVEDQNISFEKVCADLETELNEHQTTGTKTFSAKEATRLMTDDLERRFHLQGKRSGIETGFRLDNLLDGLQFGEQTILAARPSHGKTAFALNVVERAAIHDRVPTLFVSLEMSIPALMRRLLSACKSIPMQTLRTGQLSDSQFGLSTAFAAQISKSPLYFVDAVGGIDINRLTAVLRRYWRAHGIKLVIVDYLQKIKPVERHEKRTYEIASVSGALKALAVQTGAAFFTLAQLSREPEKDKGRPPRLADLADSAQIERDADTVLLLQRDRETEETRIFCAKNRDGEIGTIDLVFEGAYCRFKNY